MSLNIKLSLQRGFSLIEVLVSLLVIATGLLGNAGMQMLSINNTSIARNRSLAAIEADALASMMHANTSYWQPSTPILTACSVNGTTLGDTTLNSQATDCVSGVCTATQMAGYDLKYWGPLVASLLPAGVGNVSCTAFSATTPVSCVITVSWSESHLMLNQTGSSVTQNYTLVVQP